MTLRLQEGRKEGRKETDSAHFLLDSSRHFNCVLLNVTERNYARYLINGETFWQANYQGLKREWNEREGNSFSASSNSLICMIYLLRLPPLGILVYSTHGCCYSKTTFPEADSLNTKSSDIVYVRTFQTSICVS